MSSQSSQGTPGNPRENRPPPAIPGYEYIRDLGAGGYSVVYLYRQASLNREVAVKVLRDFDLDDVVRERFTAEATAMVQLGNHPNIVDVLDTGIAGDGSRYLIMRYYAGGNLAQRAARRGLQVTEVLDIGVRLADAVMTVHAAHLVHRDIKPANVLIDDANHNYRLSDFGIAGRLVYGHAGDAFGISVPWSAPEMVLGETGGSVAADVYSLGATLWHLLAGHSPFRLADGDNSRPALEARICAGQLPRMPRPDVPRALTDLLTGMMAVTWYARPALSDVARDLAAILNGLQTGHFTPPPLPSTGFGGAQTRQPYPADDTDDTAGRPRPVSPSDLTLAVPYQVPGEVRLNTTAPDYGTSEPGSSSGSGSPSGNMTQYPAPGTVSYQGFVNRVERSRQEESQHTKSGRLVTGDDDHDVTRRRWVIPSTVGVVVVLAAAIGIALVGGGGSSPGPGGTTPASTAGTGGGQDAGQVGEEEAPGPVTITATRADPTTLQFDWTYSSALASDTFKWQTSDGAKSGTVGAPTLSLPDPAGTQLCIQIKVVRADGSDAAVDWSAAGCGQ